MQLTIRLCFVQAAFALGLSACATHTLDSKDVAKEKASCTDGYAADDNHGSDAVTQTTFHDQTIYSYKHYFFAKAAPQTLSEFVKDRAIQLVVDFRSGASEKDLAEGYPAVYWATPLDDLNKLDAKKIDEVEQYLHTFSEKTILFVSDDGNSSVTAFVEYWADENSLNEKWISTKAADLGLKDTAWLKKWSEIEEASEEADRSSASEK